MTGLSAVKRDTRSWQAYKQTSGAGFGHKRTYVNKALPPLVEITFGNCADGLAELRLYGRRLRDHEANELLLDRDDLILRQLIVAFHILQIDYHPCCLAALGRIHTVQLRLTKFLK